MYSYSFYVVAIGCLKVKCVRVFTPVVSVPCGAELVKILFRKSPCYPGLFTGKVFTRRTDQEVRVGSVHMSVAGLGLGADLRYLESGSADDVRRLLASTFPQEKLHGMKSIFGMAALNQNVIIFFADVVKNVVIDNMEVKKLVYMYLVRYAGEQPDLALLSVNSFQRDLGDANAAIRALALRVMAAIRVPLIRPLVIIAVQKAAVDVSLTCMRRNEPGQRLALLRRDSSRPRPAL